MAATAQHTGARKKLRPSCTTQGHGAETRKGSYFTPARALLVKTDFDERLHAHDLRSLASTRVRDARSVSKSRNGQGHAKDRQAALALDFGRASVRFDRGRDDREAEAGAA
jgi:hypothetical protein